MDDDPGTDNVDLDVRARPNASHPFIAPEILQRIDFGARKQKLAKIIATNIVPRLITLHGDASEAAPADADGPTPIEVATLAKMMIDPEIGSSSHYISELKARGLSIDCLFVNLLEPTARHLGKMWENDECDFIDVTLGVARLQQLLSMFNASSSVPAFVEKRRVCMMTIDDEKHSFGISMVEALLRAGGWRVHSERGAVLEQVPALVNTEWYAVAGLMIGSEERLDHLAAVVQAIRQHSRNRSIGIMVGGPPFAEHPELAARVGADATALDAPTAVLLAQKLFDIGAKGPARDARA